MSSLVILGFLAASVCWDHVCKNRQTDMNAAQNPAPSLVRPTWLIMQEYLLKVDSVVVYRHLMNKL